MTVRAGVLSSIASAAVVCAGLGAQAETIVETVTVVDPGNAGEWSGMGYNPSGVNRPARICGAVSYAFNIGKYEVTAGQYTAFLNAVGGVDTYGLYNGAMAITGGSGISRIGDGTIANPYYYTVAADFVSRPVNYVSWGDAARFANWLHNGQPTGAQNLSTTENGAYFLNGATTDAALMAVVREADWKWAIASEDEWYKAAYYKGGGANAGYWDYATGSNTVPGRDMADASGNNANWYGYPYPGSFPIDSGKYTTLVGEFQNSDSPYGTFDQSGNVYEWNDTIIPYDSSLMRGVRGGAFGAGTDYLPASLRLSDRPTVESDGYGFRVVSNASVPEPGGVVGLVGLALMGCLYYWRRRM